MIPVTAKELRARVCICGHMAYAHWHGRPQDASSYSSCAKCNRCQKFTEISNASPAKKRGSRSLKQRTRRGS